MNLRFVLFMSHSLMLSGRYLRHLIPTMLSIALILNAGAVNGENLLDVYDLALKNDSTFQSQIYRHDASPETFKQARSELMPKVRLEASYERIRQEIHNTDVAVYGSDLAHYPTKGYTLSLTQPILKYPSYIRILQSQEEVKGADLQFEANRQDLILRVVDAYIAIMDAYDNLDFTYTEEESIRAHFEFIRERYSNGLAPVTDFHDAKARLSTMTARRSKLENELDDSLEALAEITGKKIDNLAKLKIDKISIDFDAGSEGADSSQGSNQSGTTDVVRNDSPDLTVQREVTQGTMPLVNPDPDDIDLWIDAAQKQNFEVLVQQQSVSVANQEIERQRGGHYPTLDFVARWNRDDEGGSLFGGESDLETWEAIMQLNVPIFEGLSVVSKTREAEKLHKAAEHDLDKTIRLVSREARAAFLGVKSAIDDTEALRQSVISNQIALEAKKAGFKSGMFPSLAVLDAERDLQQAKLDYTRAQYEYILNRLRLKKAVGTLSEEDINEINYWLE